MQQKILKQEEFKAVFGRRFRQALAERGKKYDDISKAVDITNKQLSMYATGKQLPTVYGLYVLCNLLDFSADFFLGLTNKFEFLEENDPLEEEILTIRESYVHMPEKAKVAFQEFVKAIIERD